MRTWQATTPKETAAQVIGWLPALVHCPDDASVLEETLEGNDNFLLMDDEEVLGWMALQNADVWGIRGFVIRPEHRKNWLTKGVLRGFAEAVFSPERPVVLFDTKVSGVLKLALRLGAKPVYDSVVPNQYGLTAECFRKGRHH